jgi:site-specific DNA recombinase
VIRVGARPCFFNNFRINFIAALAFRLDCTRKSSTSMGRLTLNVLLSFAQFEREVTAERIRDKIAASKKKGMWMGGVVPLGYDAIDRKLVVNEPEADTVRTVFNLYFSHGSVRRVKQEADRLALRTKSRKPNNGRRWGGEPFTPGHLYKLLSNPLYIGEVVHKDNRYAGEHAPLIDRACWDAVQAGLKANAVNRRNGANSKVPSLLAGLLFDDAGRRMKPSHANKAARRYRYYVSEADDAAQQDAATGWRLPASAVEDAVITGITAFLGDRLRIAKALHLTGRGASDILAEASRLADRLGKSGATDQRTMLLDMVRYIEIRSDLISISIVRAALHDAAGRYRDNNSEGNGADLYRLDIPISFKRRGVEMKLVLSANPETTSAPDPALIKAIAQGHQWFTQIRHGELKSVRALSQHHGVNQGDISRILPLGLLAPDIMEAILKGR